MALDNYANLKASIESWSHRGDVNGLIDDFILLAETEMYSNADAQIRLRDMISTETSSTGLSDRVQALPTDFLEMRSFRITQSTNNWYEIDYKTPKDMVVRANTGLPNYFTITSQIEYDVVPDMDYPTDIIYYGKLTGLSSSNTTNAILTRFPNIYLYGSLWALNQWANNEEEESKYYVKFIKAIAGANAMENEGNIGAAPQKRVYARNP